MKRIGVFDSGVGGLTVLREIYRQIDPACHLYYLGDTARVPYGNRSEETVRRYARNAARLLLEEDIDVLVVACNTASAFALESLQQTFDVPVIGVIEPVAVACAGHRSVGVIGTRGTVKSRGYERALAQLGVDHVISVACPLFVPLVEEGWNDGPVVEAIVRSYLQRFADSDMDALILGCTHYPLLRTCIERVLDDVMGRPIALYDCATTTSATLLAHLNAPPRSASNLCPSLRVMVTDEPESFALHARQFFGEDLKDIRHVDILDQERP